MFYVLAGDNIQLAITRLVRDTDLGQCRKRGQEYLTFTCLTDALKETYLRFTLHRSLQKTKQPDGANDYVPPLIMLSNPRTVCTRAKLTDNLDILIMAKEKTYEWTFHKYCASLCFVHTNLISVCTDEEFACASWTMQSTVSQQMDGFTNILGRWIRHKLWTFASLGCSQDALWLYR